MKKEYIEEMLEIFKDIDIIGGWEKINDNIYSIEDGSYYIAIDKKGHLEKDYHKIQRYIDIKRKEKDLEEEKEFFKEKYGEDYE